VSANRYYIFLIFFSALFFSVKKTEARSRLQPNHNTRPAFLKKLNHASRPIQDMLINQDGNDDDETSSKRTKGKPGKTATFYNVKIGFTLPETLHQSMRHTRVACYEIITPESVLFSRIPISIAIRCLRI
jgi:hypothetical protein